VIIVGVRSEYGLLRAGDKKKTKRITQMSWFCGNKPPQLFGDDFVLDFGKTWV